MTINISQYLEFFENISDIVKLEVRDAMRFWFPEQVPLVYLFAQVGHALVKDFPKLTEDERIGLFRHIELGMLSYDESFSRAIATGLIEGLITESFKSKNLWNEIEQYLGEESRRYAIAWMNFGE